MSDDMVETLIAGSLDAESARARLEAARVPDMRKTVVTEQSTFDPENPFALD
jgi:hypothetical protein